MRNVCGQSFVGHQCVGVQRSPGLDVLADFCLKGFLLALLNDEGTDLTTAFNDTD
ncbi:MAG: hypothetical protein ABSE57_29135 [Bryobacteraceae bacterium]|jgi:hypothetical protein